MEINTEPAALQRQEKTSFQCSSQAPEPKRQGPVSVWPRESLDQCAFPSLQEPFSFVQTEDTESSQLWRRKDLFHQTARQKGDFKS